MKTAGALRQSVTRDNWRVRLSRSQSGSSWSFSEGRRGGVHDSSVTHDRRDWVVYGYRNHQHFKEGM